MAEAAGMLGVSVKLLRRHCEDRDIRYILIGKRTRKFTPDDLREFIDRRRQECRLGSGATSTTTSSNSVVSDFVAARKLRMKRKPKE
jgi:hypothetical protein